MGFRRCAPAMLSLTLLITTAVLADVKKPAIKAYVPVYGEKVTRSSTIAIFKMVDAKGAPLVLTPDQGGAALWRHLGPYTFRENARFIPAENAVHCTGYTSSGLEPGSYTVNLWAPGYGNVLQKFEITRGKPIVQRVCTPNWRRIIVFKFEDANGNAVPALPSAPSYDWNSGDYSGPELAMPADVLRLPPHVDYGGGGRGGRGGFASTTGKSRRFLTDDGRVYVRVFAGVKGKVRFALDKGLFGTDESVFEGTFVEDKWSETIVKVTLAADYDSVMAKRAVVNKDDPGRKSVNTTAVAAPLPDPEKTPPSAGNVRVKWHVDNAPIPVWPVITVNEGFRVPAYFEAGHYWWLDVPRGAKLAYVMCDGLSYLEDPQAPELPEKADVLDLKPQVAFPTFTLRLPTQTLCQWAQGGCLSSVFFETKSSQFAQTPGVFRTVLSPAVRARFAAAENFWLKLGSGIEPLQSRSVIYPYGPARPVYIDNRLGDFVEAPHLRNLIFVDIEKYRADLATGKAIDKTLPLHGLVFRACADKCGGIPCVEASVISGEDEDTASAMRDVEIKLAQQKLRPDLSAVDAEKAAAPNEVTDETTDAELKNALGEGIYNLYPTRAMRLRLAKYGTWYDNLQILRSDGGGYVVDLGRELAVGKRYVLYLWSNSRDDLKPDLRIEFVATNGVTDLGAITLPPYANK